MNDTKLIKGETADGVEFELHQPGTPESLERMRQDVLRGIRQVREKVCAVLEK